MQFCSSDSNFFAPATEISEICDFWPKIAIFWLLRGHRALKLGPRPKIFLQTLLGVFGAARFFFGHPAPTTRIFGHRNFCIWPFLGEKSQKLLFFAFFGLK